MPAQPVIAGSGHPRAIAVAMEAPQRPGVAHVGRVVRRRVVAAQIARREVRGRNEPPVVVRNVRIHLVVAERRPADVAIADAPLHPRRSPPRVRTPHPAVPPDPPPVVIGGPPERILRDPVESVVGVRPVPVRVRDVARHGRHEHVPVRGIVVPAAIRLELIVEDLDVGDFAAGGGGRNVDVHRIGGHVVGGRLRSRLVVRIRLDRLVDRIGGLFVRLRR